MTEESTTRKKTGEQKIESVEDLGYFAELFDPNTPAPRRGRLGREAERLWENELRRVRTRICYSFYSNSDPQFRNFMPLR